MKKIEIEVKKNLCKSCGICYVLCPKGVLAGDENGKAAVVNQDACTGCRLCEMRCPDFAIRVRRDMQ